MTWDEKRNYDNSDLDSVIERAQLMIDKSLQSIDIEISGESDFNPNNRGYAGLIIENWFIDRSTAADPDLPDLPHPSLDHIGLEIKSIPLREGIRKPWLVGEPMSLTMINYPEIYSEKRLVPINESVIFSKDRWTLVVYYHLDPDNKPKGKVLGIGIWDLEHLNFEQIMSEYIRANRMIIDGKANQLTETLFSSGTLSARGKGSSGQKTNSGPPGIKTKPRTWALKTKYVRKRLEMDGLDSIIEHDGVNPEKSDIFSQKFIEMIASKWTGDVNPMSEGSRVMVEHFEKFAVGKTVGEVAKELDYPMKGSKDLHGRVARMVLHSRPGGLGDKGKLRAPYIEGSLIKVFYVNNEFKPTESGVRMPHVPLIKLVKEEVDSSSMLGNIEHVMLLPVRKGDTMGESEFLTPVYWIPNKTELSEITREWKIFRDGIRQGLAARLPNGRHRLPSKRKMKWLHMRSSPAGGTELDPLGNDCTKMCFWLNDSAVQKLILERQT